MLCHQDFTKSCVLIFLSISLLILNVKQATSQPKLETSKIIYKKGRYTQLNITTIEDKKLQDQIKKVAFIETQLEYELLFNAHESLFQLTINSHLNRLLPEVILALGYKEIFYTNQQSQYKVRHTAAIENGFNIKSILRENKWTKSSEFKFIKGYKCYKATSSLEIQNPITNQYEAYHPIVWFTHDIPVPFGPNRLDGLPGLVLEGTFNGNTFFYATKISLNSVDILNLESKIPKVNTINKKEYAKIIASNFKKRKKLRGY